MAKAEQVLILDPPDELKFKGPFDNVITSQLNLSNPTAKRVCFKVKTTAPRRYCVRPNSGIIDAHSSMSVAVMLQPFEYDRNNKNKHKFMVQSIYAPEGEVNLEALFRDADQNQLMDSKLRCVFELPADAQATQNNIDAPPPPSTQQSHVEVLKPSPKPNSFDSELKKAIEEVKQLRAETSSLRQENFQLKEDVLRLRSTSSNISSGEKSPMPMMVVSPDSQGMSSSMQWMVVCAIAVLSFFLGKFIL